MKIAFQTILEGEKPPNGFQYINGHMVLGIKMEDFCRKACLVTGSHMTHTLDTIAHSSVVTRETVHIALTMAALYGLEVKEADVLKAYEMAPNKKKIWTVFGPEFEDDAGKSAINVRALYGLKSAVASFKHILHNVCRSLGINLVMQTLTC